MLFFMKALDPLHFYMNLLLIEQHSRYHSAIVTFLILCYTCCACCLLLHMAIEVIGFFVLEEDKFKFSEQN